jgi:hypothetical protein
MKRKDIKKLKDRLDIRFGKYPKDFHSMAKEIAISEKKGDGRLIFLLVTFDDEEEAKHGLTIYETVSSQLNVMTNVLTELKDKMDAIEQNGGIEESDLGSNDIWGLGIWQYFGNMTFVNLENLDVFHIVTKEIKAVEYHSDFHICCEMPYSYSVIESNVSVDLGIGSTIEEAWLKARKNISEMLEYIPLIEDYIYDKFCFKSYKESLFKSYKKSLFKSYKKSLFKKQYD